MHLRIGSALFRVGGALYFVLIYDFVIGVFFFFFGMSKTLFGSFALLSFF